MEKVKFLSAVEQIRSSPDKFFVGGKPTNDQLIAAVMADVGECKQFKARVICEQPFTMVTANVDWLETGNGDFQELFERFVLPRSRGPNCHRAEILLIAVCEQVLAIGANGQFTTGVELRDFPEHFLRIARRSVRTLAWKFTSE